MFGAGVEKLIIKLLFEARFPGDSTEGFVAAGEATLRGFDAHFMDFLSRSLCGFLHG